MVRGPVEVDHVLLVKVVLPAIRSEPFNLRFEPQTCGGDNSDPMALENKVVDEGRTLKLERLAIARQNGLACMARQRTA